MEEQPNFFGLFKGQKVFPHDKNELETFLLSKGLFHNVYSVTLSSKAQRIVPPIEPPIPKPTKELVNAFYNHLLQFYQNDIDTIFYRFFVDFNEEIFGLEEKQQRAIALNYFKVLSKRILTTAVKFFGVNKTKDGFEQVKNMGILQTLIGQREALKNNLLQLSALISYLKGIESDKWVAKTFKSEKELDDFLEFEAILKIVENLNSVYKFENKNREKEKVTVRHKLKKSQEFKNKNKKTPLKKKSISSDKEALNYLIKNVFGVDFK